MNQLPRFRLRKELAVTCLTLAISVGIGDRELSAQSVTQGFSSTEFLPAKNIERSAIPQSAYLNSNGQLVGQVQILGAVSRKTPVRMKVDLLTIDGQLVETSLDNRGAFAFTNIKPGVYALVGQADGILVCQAIRVFAHEAQMDDIFDLYAVAPATPEMENAVSSGYGSKVASNTDVVLPGTPGSYATTNGVIGLSSEGLMHGQLWSARGNVSGTSVTIYQNGVSVAKSITDASGKFSVKLLPGIYSLVASGTSGVAAVGFKAEGERTTISKTKAPKNVQLVSLEASFAAPVLVVGLAPPLPPRPTVPVENALVNTVPQSMNVSGGGSRGSGGGGGFGGVSSGGGGGAGVAGRQRGVGGLGALAAIGAVAVGVTALATNNNAPVVSPSGQ